MNQNFAQKILSKSEFCTKIISDATFDRMDPLFLKKCREDSLRIGTSKRGSLMIHPIFRKRGIQLRDDMT
jgi:hypothetical protein